MMLDFLIEGWALRVKIKPGFGIRWNEIRGNEHKEKEQEIFLLHTVPQEEDIFN